MKRRICILLLLVVLALTFAACSRTTDTTGTADTSTGTEGATDEPTGNPTTTDQPAGSTAGGTTGSTAGGTTDSTAPNNGATAQSGGEATQNSESEKVTTPAGNIPTTEPITEVPENITECTYEDYQNMTPEVQQAFFEKFEDMEAFFAWYNAAKAQYEKENAAIEIENGEIDISRIDPAK